MSIILLSLYTTNKSKKLNGNGGDKNKLTILYIRNLVSNI